ncbi:SCO family protein [Luteirhabdus pelagi]|uniref:SCO family protein n=1 Tax=Luteirhabdus pelagi TaxID=2792783 RepID=UPI00193AD86A|nr:SCO family protein [Luteirhabdus pelagi]
MLRFFAKYKFFGVVLLVLSAIIVTIIYQIYDTDSTFFSPQKKLPIFQPSEVNSELVDTTVQYVKKYHTISDFSLVNQNGDTITEKNYEGKIYVADFFFTTCQTICPVMTDHMSKLQVKLEGDEDVLLLSHSVTPEIDTVAQLKRYAIEKGVNDSKWNLVTGDKKQIYDLARKSYLAAKDVPYNKYDLVHTENFVLVDKKKRIRGFYDGTDPESIEQILRDIKTLKASE